MYAYYKSSTELVTEFGNKKDVCNFQRVNTTSLSCTVFEIWWITSPIWGCLSLAHLLGLTSIFGMGKYGHNKLRNIHLLYGAKVFWYLKPFRHKSWVWQTYRQTLSDSTCCASYVAACEQDSQQKNIKLVNTRNVS